MGIRFIKIAVVYFVIGILLGLYMSLSHSYVLSDVHAHINLLGWTSMGLAGLIYHLFPQLGTTSLGKAHFWLHNIGLPIMMIALAFLLSGYPAAEPIVAVGGFIVVIAIILFAINVLANLKKSNT
jgi:cbb3-type cytochrome oxidase subunit 1